MMKIKVMTVFGTRPETIKMAPLVKELKKREEIETIVCVTAQHRQMLDQVLHAFQIVPDYDLDIMKQGQTLSDITTRVLQGLESVIKEVNQTLFWFMGIQLLHLQVHLLHSITRWQSDMWKQGFEHITNIHLFQKKRTDSL